MIFKNFKRLVAQLLLIMFIFPNISVQALTNDKTTVNEKDISIEENIDTNEIDSITEEEVTEEEVTEDYMGEEELSTEESTLNNSSETIEENTEENIDKTEQISEETNSTEVLKGKKYTKVKAINPNVRGYSTLYSEEELSREEFKLKQEAIENLEILEPMTDSDYELAIANADGSFEYLASYDDIDTAVNAANSESNLDESQLPAVINSEGQVVYSTNQMARILKYVNNANISGTVNIYSDVARTSTITYVNQSYMDDAPILATSGTSAKVHISGVEGWINNNKASGTYDMVVVPLNQAKNPSYYTVENGELIHFISYDLVGTTGYKKILGKAPSILKEGVRYLSYDGMYFYKYDHSNQTSISNALNTLISDYKSGVRTNSINRNNPYYLYYLYLPFRSQTVYTAAELNKFLTTHSSIGTTSKLYNTGQVFKDAETKYGVNALLALGIAINESGYGNSQIAKTKNNLFGLAAYDSNESAASKFDTVNDCVVDFAKNYISRGYADPADWRYYGGYVGNKYRGANVKYASDPFWGEKAASFAYEIDKYLSVGNSELKDTNSKQLGMAKSSNSVINSLGSLLYNVLDHTNDYGAYTYTPFVITDLQKVTINGKSYYEINPERDTAVGKGGSANKYHGNYNWNSKGYILASNIQFINVYTPQVKKLYGDNRYETSAQLSKSSFTSAETIVISNGYAIPDGLTATPIASHYKAPLLLVAKSSIPSETQTEIKRLGAKKAIIVGGTGVVDNNVVSQLKKLGVTNITRLGGSDRYETALQVAQYIDKNLYDVSNVIIAGGLGEADALSIAPVAGRDKMPIILVPKDSVTSSVYNWLKSESLSNAYVIGGTGVVNDSVLNKINSITSANISGNRLGGADRYITNAKVIQKFYGEVVENVYVTVGLTLADALSSGPVAALNGSPVVLSANTLNNTQKNLLNKYTTNKIIQVGGQVSGNVINNLKELLSRTE